MGTILGIIKVATLFEILYISMDIFNLIP
jgi:hypothetical protein